MAPMARAEKEATMKEARILMVLIWVVEKILLGERRCYEDVWRWKEKAKSHGEQSERRRDIN